MARTAASVARSVRTFRSSASGQPAYSKKALSEPSRTPGYNPRVIAALGWGALAASSLVIGALLGVVRPWPDRPVGLVLAFGAGALISAVSFDLAEEGARIGDPGFLALGLATGALTYFGLNRAMGRRSRGGGNAGTALALGAFLDGIPEQMVL